jgi:polyhydroxybutyrate depolymerase
MGRLGFGVVVAVAALAPLACGSGSDARPAGNADAGLRTTMSVLGRQVTARLPSGYAGKTPLSVVIGIHGWGSDSDSLARWLALEAEADVRGTLLLYPLGTMGADGKRFWNATDACCDFGHTGVDDVAFFRAVIDAADNTWLVDRSRVYVMGHSNGGFMSHRLACALSDRIAAIVSIEGAVYADASECRPASTVAIVELHGTSDASVHYGGGTLVAGAAAYPGAERTVATWASVEGCTGPLQDTGALLDVDDEAGVTGQHMLAYSGCRADVALWRMDGGTHTPSFTDKFRADVFDFFVSHPKLETAASSRDLSAGTGTQRRARR